MRRFTHKELVEVLLKFRSRSLPNGKSEVDPGGERFEVLGGDAHELMHEFLGGRWTDPVSVHIFTVLLLCLCGVRKLLDILFDASVGLGALDWRGVSIGN